MTGKTGQKRFPFYRITAVIGILIIGGVFPVKVLPATCSATTTLHINHLENVLSVSVVTVASGTSALNNLRISINVAGFTDRSLMLDRLSQGAASRVEFTVPVDRSWKGSYPVTVRSDFSDKTGFPYSSYTCSVVSFEGISESDLSLSVHPVSLKQKGRMNVTLTDTGGTNKYIKLTCRLPGMIWVDPEEVLLISQPGKTVQSSFRLINRYAEPGDSFTVYCIAEYQQGDRHHTAIAEQPVAVKAGMNMFRKYRWFWVLLTVVTGVGFCVCLIIEKPVLIKRNQSSRINHETPPEGSVLLINPCSNTVSGQSLLKRAWQPLELANSAALLESHGIYVRIIDGNAGKVTPGYLASVSNGYDFVFLTSAPYDRWQCPPVDILQFLDAADAISNHRLYIMGPHPTERPEALLQRTEARAAIIGEPETVIPDIVLNDRNDRFPNTIPGTAWLDEGGFHTCKNDKSCGVSEFPLPAFHLLDMTSYYYELMGDHFCIMEASRGCPFHCSFCYKGMYGNRFCQKDAKDFVTELIQVKERFSIRNVYFMDLEFGLNRSWLKVFCNELIEKKVHINWCCQTRVADVDDDLLAMMKASGCSLIHFGIESGAESVLESTGKQISHQECFSAVRLAEKHGIRTALFFSFGFCGETQEDMNSTIDFAVKLNPTYASFNILVPYPGTRLAAETGSDTESSGTLMYSHYNKACHEEKMLKKMVRKAWVRFYLRPSYLAGYIKNGYKLKLSQLMLFFRRV